jgi:murein DD-endopeptidase MepM/ murein hydrolase activator NlpD
MSTCARSPWLQRVLGVLVVTSFGLGIAVASPVVAQSSETAAEQAAREIGEARDRANAAAQAWAEAQSELDQLDVLTARTEEEIAALEDEIAELRVAVEEAAINRFVTGSTGGIPLLSGLDGPTDQAQADVFAAIATDISAEAFDDYDAVAEELADKKAQLERQEADTLAAAEYLEEVEAAAYAEVELLREIEEERLQDEAVRKALEAQQAEKLRQADELARQQLAQQQAEAARQAAAAAADDDDETSTDSAAAGSSSGSSGVVVLPPASGGTSGGSTGAVSGGSSYIDGIVCPVAGPSAFGDTWGAPRSGGRRHEGVDMLGPTGTPLAAVVSGYAEFKTNTLGGKAVGLKGSNGNYYYYAHLDRWEGGSRNVTRGEIIGYMGDTGNATGTPHLHFEIHPGGGAAVNPYPSVRAVC